jgi:alcohol dehydrogenase class IV
MPYVLAYNRAAIEDRMVRLAAWLDLPNPSFGAVMDWAMGLREQLKIPHTLKEIGVGDDRLDEISEMAAVDPTAPTNPIPVGAPELKSMLVAALEGRVG